MLAAWPDSQFFFLPPSEFPSEEIERGHPGETVAIRSQIAECPLNVQRIEIPGKTRWGGREMIAAAGKSNPGR